MNSLESYAHHMCDIYQFFHLQESLTALYFTLWPFTIMH